MRIPRQPHSSRAACLGRLFELLEATLINQPTMGRPGRVTGTRELLVHRHYILAYRVRGEAIELLAFRHSARLWSDGFKE